MPDRRFVIAIGLAALLGVTARLCLVAIALEDPARYSSPDSADYRGLADSLSSGRGFALEGVPSYLRVPAYPLLLAACQWLLGDGAVGGLLLFQALSIAPAIGLMIWLVSEVLRVGPRAALAVAVVLAFDPALVGHSAMLLSETWLFLFSSLAIALSAAGVRSGQLRFAWLAGVASGLASLFHPAATYAWTAGCAAHLVDSRRTPARRGVLAISLLLGHVLVLAPWLARNARLFGDPSLTTTSLKTMVLKAAIIEDYALERSPRGLLGLLAGTPSDAEVLNAFRERHPELARSGLGSIATIVARHPRASLKLGLASELVLLLDPGYVAVLKPLGQPLGTGLMSRPGATPSLSLALFLAVGTAVWMLVLWGSIMLGVFRLARLDRPVLVLALTTVGYYTSAFSVGSLTTGCRYRLAMLPALALLASLAWARLPRTADPRPSDRACASPAGGSLLPGCEPSWFQAEVRSRPDEA